MQKPFSRLHKWLRDHLQDIHGTVDDLHLDEIDPRFKKNHLWLDGVSKIITNIFADDLSSSDASRIAIAIPLKETGRELSTIDVKHLTTNDLCYTPPSVYVAPIETNFAEFGPWMNSANQTRFIDGDPLQLGNRELRFAIVDCVFYNNHIRTFWVFRNCKV